MSTPDIPVRDISLSGTGHTPADPGSGATRELLAEPGKIDYQKIFESAPALFLLLDADGSFGILDASDAYLRATYTERDAIVGRSLFEVFPDNPEDPKATGVTNLRASLKRVLADGRPDTMAVQKYDVRRRTGGFEERYWSPVNAPVFGPDGRILYVLHRVEDVTEISDTKQVSAQDGETMRLEVMLRAQEVQEANRQLRELTEQFQAIYDQGLFAARLRLDGTVLDINRSAVEVCGFNRADILDKPYVPGEDPRWCSSPAAAAGRWCPHSDFDRPERTAVRRRGSPLATRRFSAGSGRDHRCCLASGSKRDAGCTASTHHAGRR